MSRKHKEIARRFYSLFPVKSQAELSKFLMVTPATVSQWMNGVHPVPRDRLMQAYADNKEKGVTLDWILGTDIDFPSSPDTPAPNFRTEVSGIIRDAMWHARDALTVMRDWWTNRHQKQPDFPDLEEYFDASLFEADIDSMTVSDALFVLRKMRENTQQMRDALPEFHVADANDAAMLLMQHDFYVYRIECELKMQVLSTRIEFLEGFLGKRSPVERLVVNPEKFESR